MVGLSSNSKVMKDEVKPTEKKTAAAEKVGLKVAELASREAYS